MYDILIIGTGPGGYVAAIRAAQLGLKVACIEKSYIGGTCLNVGCIPSKSLLDSSLKHYQLQNDYEDHGIYAGEVNFDLAKMMSRKQNVIKQLANGVGALFKVNKIDLINGKAKIKNINEVEVVGRNETFTLEAKNIIIGTGSKPNQLDDLRFNRNIIDSEEALKFDRVPSELVIIGAGVIGLELGSVWSRLGSKVTILESQNEFLPFLGRRISRQILREFKNQGLNLELGCNIVEVLEEEKFISINYSQKGKELSLKAEKIILAVGRKPYVGDLFDEDLIKINEKGQIEVNEFCQTNQKNIWAIGDVVRGPMLAHKASEEGLMVVERIAGEETTLNYNNIPNVIYTHPEIAWVGLNEDQLKDQGVEFKSGSFPFLASGRALASGETVGSVQITANSNTDEILGIQVFGNSASEILQQGLIAMDNGITSAEFSKSIVSHPTVSETLLEASLAMNNKAIHIQNKK